MTTGAKVRRSLIDQLRQRGAAVDVNLALVDDYMKYFEMEKKAHANIKEKGMTYRAISSTGKEYDKDNPSIKIALDCNKQKLSILARLEIAPSTVAVEEDDEL